MKTKLVLKVLAFIAFIAIFASCSNLTKDDELFSNGKNDSFVIHLGLNKPHARLIRAFDYSLESIENWTITFTDESDNSNIFKVETSDEESTLNTFYATYDSESATITAKMIPEGTYTVELEGTYTKDDTSYTICGSASGISISANSIGEASIFVGPKSTDDGTGAISLILTDSNQTLSDLSSSLKVKLTNISSSNIYYTTDSSDSEKSGSLTFASSADDTSTYTLSGDNIKSGWYKIYFSVDDTYRIYLPDNPDKFVEIVDNITTSSKANIAAEKGRALYATNKSSSYNGLSSSSPMNLTSLFEKLSENMPTEGNIYIYVDEIPEIKIETFNSFRETVESENKQVFIYNESKDVSLTLGDDSGTFTTTINNSLSIKGSTDNTEFEADAISLTEDSTITLEDGAFINAQSVTSFGSSENDTFYLNLYATSTKETENVDNLSSYSASPFLITGANLSKYILLYEYGSEDVSEDYTITSKQSDKIYNHYIKLSGNGTITPTLFNKTVSINAKYSSKSETYSTDAAISYLDDTLTFSLNGLDDENVTYTWYLNSNSLGTESEVSFNPYTQDELNIDSTNSVLCNVEINDTTYVTEFKFTFIATRSAAVWFDGINSSSSTDATATTYALKQTTGYNSTTASELVSSFSTSSAYCFDSSCNLWTAVLSDSELTLTKYKMNVSDGFYNTVDINIYSISEITTTPLDITYDVVNNYLYAIVESGDSVYTLYQISLETEPSVLASGTISITNSDDSGESSETPSQIAVYDKTVYVGTESGKVFYNTIDLSINESSLNVSFDSSINLFDDDFEWTDECSITDLQIGDGLGNETESLFALVRQYTAGWVALENDMKIYSRGYLIKTSLDNNSQTKFGYTDESTTITDDVNTGTLYAPTSSTNTFYGPTRFVAVVPKKLVILDDGFAYYDDFKLENKDSFVEFDIENEVLTRGASVSATMTTNISGFTTIQ